MQKSWKQQCHRSEEYFYPFKKECSLSNQASSWRVISLKNCLLKQLKLCVRRLRTCLWFMFEDVKFVHKSFCMNTNLKNLTYCILDFIFVISSNLKKIHMLPFILVDKMISSNTGTFSVKCKYCSRWSVEI